MSKRDGRKKVLFVCIGNACRSPMAEAIARLDAPDAIDAFSAGLSPIGFVPELTKQTLMSNGYWVEGLESKRISPGVWKDVDVVINLSGHPKEEAFEDHGKVVDWEVADPFASGPEEYQRAFDKIRKRVRELAEEYRKEYAATRVAERRSRPRLCPTSPIWMSLNGWTDARVVNINEDGLCISSETPLPSQPLQNLRIQFAARPKGLEARCQIAWKTSDNKQAGIQFAGLTEEEHQFIRSWISAQAPYIGFQIQIDRTREEQNLRLEIPKGSEVGVATRPRTNEAPKTRHPAPAPAASGTLGSGFGSPIGTRSGVRATTIFQNRIKVLSSKVAARVTKTGSAWRPWSELAAVLVLTAVFTVLLHAAATHREVPNDVRAAAAPELAASNERAKPAPLTSPSSPAATKPSDGSNPPDGNGRAALWHNALSPSAEPLPVNKTAVADDVRRDTAATSFSKTASAIAPPSVEKAHDGGGANSLKSVVRPPSAESVLAKKVELADEIFHKAGGARSAKAAARGTEKSSRSEPAKTAKRVAENKSPGKQPPKAAPHFTGSTNTPPVRRRAPETVASTMPVPPPLEVKLPETSNLAAARSAEARPTEPETKTSAAPPAKQPVAKAQMTAEVSVLADPYPSLLAKEDGLKKQKKGAASLQLGHLVSRVVPVYPEDAKRQGIQGTVKLHAVVNKYGSVRSMQTLSGSPVLGAAAMDALRRWQYSETTLGGRPVETEVDVAVVFRLSNAATPKS